MTAKGVALLLALVSAGCVPALTAFGGFADGYTGYESPAPPPSRPLVFGNCTSRQYGGTVFTHCN